MKTELHRSRPQPTENPGPKMSPENREKQKEKASSCMVITFNDGNTRSFWSNEWKLPWKFRHIGDTVNEHMKVFEKYFRPHAAKAAIFDTRECKVAKDFGAQNKIYQYEKKAWSMVKQFNW